MNTRTTPLLRIGILLAAAVALTGCAPATPTVTSSPAGDAITIHDAWVKAADSGMSAAFGELTNSGSAVVTIVSATTPASSMVELHETVANDAGQMVMRQREGGFAIPPKGSFPLAPGGNHIMLMDLKAPLKAGEEVPVTLTFSDGSTYAFTAPVKDYSGANENYVSGSMGMGQ